jgi:hypothetical protein
MNELYTVAMVDDRRRTLTHDAQAARTAKRAAQRNPRVIGDRQRTRRLQALLPHLRFGSAGSLRVATLES